VFHQIEEYLLVSLACVELFLPACELDIKLHNLVHMVDVIRRHGPLWTGSMFPYEHLWHKMGKWVTNRRYPETTMMHTLSHYLTGWLHLFASRTSGPGSMQEMQENWCEELYLPRDPIDESYDGMESRPAFEAVRDTLLDMVVVEQLHYMYVEQLPDYGGVWNEWLSKLKQGLAQQQGMGGYFRRGDLVSEHFPSVFQMFKASSAVQQEALRKGFCLDWPMVGRKCDQVKIKHLWFNCKEQKEVTASKGSWCLLRAYQNCNTLQFGRLLAFFHHTGPGGISKVIGKANWHASNAHSIPEYDEVLQMPVIKEEHLPHSRKLLPLFRCGDWIVPVHITVAKHYKRAGWLVVLHQDRCFVQLAGPGIVVPDHDALKMREKMGRVNVIKHFLG
jgi:hypothetical protein